MDQPEAATPPETSLGTADRSDPGRGGSDPADRAEPASVREDLRAALRSLDEARREFERWSEHDPQPSAPQPPEPSIPQPPRRRFEPRSQPRSGSGASPRPPATTPRPEPRAAIDGLPGLASPDDTFRRAELEASAYLENAKRRVDSLCRSMLGTIEEEARALRREAEEAIRMRWSDAEAEAEAYLAGSRSQADSLVEHRRARIVELSESITRGAARITSRLDDADRVQQQFDRLVGALSATAERIALELGSESWAPGESRRG